MVEDLHKNGLYRWKRQENQRVYSRSQKVTTDNDIYNWIQKVEEVSNKAAAEVFGLNNVSGRARGKAVAKATKEYTKTNEQACSEARDLLSKWMEEKVNLMGEPEIDSHYEDDTWEKYEIQSDVKKEWDNLLANNYDEYGLLQSSSHRDLRFEGMYDFDEDSAVANVMKDMLDKPVVKKEFKKDLGLDKWGKQKDPTNKMELRHKQVKENREKREAELRKRREELQNRKEVQSMAQKLVQKEEKEKEIRSRREEMEIRKEMAKIRKDMQEDKKKMEEKQARERQAREEALLSAKVKVAWNEKQEEHDPLEEQRKHEEQQRVLAQRIKELETREAANNLKILHRHFSAWYNLVLDKHLKMGKARAMYDWKVLLRAWNAWRSYVRTNRLEVETKQQEQEVINSQRNQQKAEKHNKMTLMKKYFIAWQVWVQSERDRRELEQASNNTRNKMISLLEAAASGKLWNQNDTDSARSTARDKAGHKKSDRSFAADRPSTADKISAMFEHNRKTQTKVTSTTSTARSDVTMETHSHHQVPRSCLPTEPWQITRRHLELSPEEMKNMTGGEPTCSPEEMNKKILKKLGRQPWHKKEVSVYEHRHAAHKKILEDQKQQILEQKRLLEELQFKNTHVELQKQLAEQKLVLEQMQQQMVITNNNVQSEHSGEKLQLDLGSTKHENKIVPCANVNPGSKLVNSKSETLLTKDNGQSRSSSAEQKTQSQVSLDNDSARSGATKNRMIPNSSRTDVSKQGSYASTAAESAKYLQVLRNMEERAAERARSKKEREDKRRKAEEERLAGLEAIAEAQRQKDEEEKRLKAEAFKEKKRKEQEKKLEQQLLEGKFKQLTELANQHYQKSLLKYRGIVPMKKMVAIAKEQGKKAQDHFEKNLQRKVLLTWHIYIRDSWKEKEAIADEMANFLCIKHCYQSWRLYKHHMIIEEHKAKKHYERIIKGKIFQTWRDYANEEKVAFWEKERKSREHYTRLLVRRHFLAWQRLPEEIEKEKERQMRLEQLRQKVSSILPDFEPSNSVHESTELEL